jgi:hypothetical protein
MNENETGFDKQLLVETAQTKMPFGRFKNQYLHELPEAYLLWFQQKGFPKGKLGERMALALEMKINGLEYILRDILKMGER